MDYVVHHMLRRSAENRPDAEALVHEDERVTFAEFRDRAWSLAAGLVEIGLDPHDRVAIQLDPSVELAVSIFGVSRAGGVFVPIHHSLRAPQVRHIVTDCGCRGLVTTATRLADLESTLAECPSIEWVVVLDVEGDANAATGLPTYDYRAFEQLGSEPTRREVVDGDLAAILYTSGSTGKPKGVMLSHANVVAGATIVSDYLGLRADDRILAALPLSFDAGLNQLTTSVQQGAALVFKRFVFGREIVNTLVKERITGLAGVPPLWSLLAQPSSKLASTPLPHLRYITNTGGAMPGSLLESLRAALPETDVVLMYGLTEAFRSTYLPPSELDHRPGSMGWAIPNTEILVVDEHGHRCAPGEVGELVHHGPTVSLGYWGQPELTAERLRPHPFPPAGFVDPPKVCYSGDLVRMDEEGYLYFVGRRDNMIKTSGFRVSPTEVEEALTGSGLLQGAAVVGIPDDVLGQRIVAFVAFAEGAERDEAALADHAAGQLPRHMLPKSIVVLDALPRTSSGKTDYATLRTSALEREATPTAAGST